MKRYSRSITATAIVLFVLLALAPTLAIAAIIFESGTLGPTGIPWSDFEDQTELGVNVNSEVFQGVRFELPAPAHISRIGGHFVAPHSGTFFGAIVALDAGNDFPDSEDLSTPDVLGAALLTFPVSSAEVFGDLALLLEPGWYALVFGSGLFDATGVGGVPVNNTDIGTPDYIGFMTGFGWGHRLHNKRFVVEGMIIPEPSATTLSLFTSILLLGRTKFSA